ncbi:hypothetical protein SMICM304S_03249 [Streptomyces microflavus]
MERQELLLTIENALSEVLERPVSGLTEETALFDELQLTSIAVLGMLMSVEEATGISVDPGGARHRRPADARLLRRLRRGRDPQGRGDVMSGLAVRAAASVRSPRGRAPEGVPAALDYFRDLLTPFGEKPDEELLSRGPHVHHRDLVDLLVADEGVGGSRPELAIVAHALPDVVPFTAVAPHLTEQLAAGRSTSRSASRVWPRRFTALRIDSLGSTHSSARAAEVVIAVLEVVDDAGHRVAAAETAGAAAAVAELIAWPRELGDGEAPRAVVLDCHQRAGSTAR